MQKFLLLFLVFMIGCEKPNHVLTDQKISRSELILMHNKQRCLNQCDLQLIPEESLTKTAQKWADHMASKKNLSHSALEINGTEFWMMGENIAEGQSDVDTVISDWMKSKGHRTNIINKKFTHIGVGYACSDQGRAYWCAQFGAK